MPRTIIGRIKEKEILSKALASETSELIVVHGRRRIGKTFLIREYYHKETIFSVTGFSIGDKAVQIKNFMSKLEENHYKPEDGIPKDWMDCFGHLKKYLNGIRGEGKKVLFIDEFPWIAKNSEDFVPAFENFWADYCMARTDIIAVVCGSAASFMVKKIINNYDGLGRRVSRELRLRPFKLHEVKAFFQHKKIEILDNEILKIYMSLGGIPEYLEQIERGESTVQIINRLCFDEGAYLENEFDNVFASLFETSENHKRIILALSQGRKKGMLHDELVKACGMNVDELSHYLNELIVSGFAQQYDSYSGKNAETLYRIYDEFCLFHLQFMTKYKGSSWDQLYQKAEYSIWCGFAFESVCLKHVEELKNELEIGNIDSQNYTWDNPRAQIDLVIDRADNWVNICEMKFYNGPFTIDRAYMKRLENKKVEFSKDKGENKTPVLTMVTTYGVTNNRYYKEIVDKNLTTECLFQ